MKRSDLAFLVADLVGGVLEIHDPQNGWPALGTLDVDDGYVLEIALFPGPIGLTHRDRDGVERRFQNPAASNAERKSMGWTGKPLVVPDGRVPLLIGVWTDDEYVEVPHPVLVMADAYKREGLTSRHSVFQSPTVLLEAANSGWAENVNDDGERMPCFDPQLLPAVALAADSQVDLRPRDVQIAVDAAGLVDARYGEDEVGAAERARRTVSALVRDRRFSQGVIAAYEGRCAMCGLALGLIEGAHIFPASAVGSTDALWNGVCLCSNHHTAFDRHLIWVHPIDRTIWMHPAVLEVAETDSSAADFVRATFEVLSEPEAARLRPRDEMFEARYAHFDTAYGWV